MEVEKRGGMEAGAPVTEAPFGFLRLTRLMRYCPRVLHDPFTTCTAPPQGG